MPCTIRAGEESLGGPARGGTEDTLGSVAICDGVDSTSVDETTGGPDVEDGDPEAAEDLKALVGDNDSAAAADANIDFKGGFVAVSLTGEPISGC